MNVTRTPAFDYRAIARDYFRQAHQILSDPELAREYGTTYIRLLCNMGELALLLEEHDGEPAQDTP